MSAETAGATVLTEVTARHLCCGCGACVAACPSEALAMVETAAGYVWAAAAAGHECTHCGLCLRVCPSRSADATPPPSPDPNLGESVRAEYWARAKDAPTREEGSSGGVVTALLTQWLEAGAIEAALVARWSPDNPLRAEGYWAHCAADLKPSQKSKYCTIPLLSCLAPGSVGCPSEHSRIAVVGLPCQLQALAKLQERVKLPRIVATIGLFCDRVLSYHVVAELLEEAGAAPSAVEEFQYRHKGLRGWPGDVFVRPRGEDPRFVERSRRMRLKEFYTPTRCRLCPDKFNSLADLACGDAYGGPKEAHGLSALLVRTEAGEALLTAAGDCLDLTPLDAAAFRKAHHAGDRLHEVNAYRAAYGAVTQRADSPLPEDLTGVEGAAPYADALRYSLAFEQATSPTEARTLARARQAATPEPRKGIGLRTLARRVLGRLTGRPPSR